MAVLGNEQRNSFKYTSTLNQNDSSTRTISGLNAFDASIPGSGSTGTNAINVLINTITRLSDGTMSNVYWVQERSVTL